MKKKLTTIIENKTKFHSSEFEKIEKHFEVQIKFGGINIEERTGGTLTLVFNEPMIESEIKRFISVMNEETGLNLDFSKDIKPSGDLILEYKPKEAENKDISNIFDNEYWTSFVTKTIVSPMHYYFQQP